jgi:putative ABC transport system permease protein
MTDQKLLQTTPGVARVEFQRTTTIMLDRRRAPVALIARAIDARDPAARLALVGNPRLPLPGDPPPIWVSEAMVDIYDYSPGKRVLLPIAGKWVTFTVAGVWRDYARQHGAIVLRQADYRRLTHDVTSNEATIWLDPGGSAAQVTEALKRRLKNGERLEIRTSGEIRAASLETFDRSFAVTYLLEAVAIIIGIVGIAASFGSQALARTREFGMLRHLGVTRRQIGAMLALEGALLGGLGIAAGLALGFVVAVILIRVVNPQSFHWTMALTMPWSLLASVGVFLIAASALTAAWAGRRAMATTAVRAVKEDW